MADVRGLYAVLCLLIIGVQSVSASYYCYQYGYYSGFVYHSGYYFYCEYGCCGSYGNEYCCTYSVGAIVGGVIGGIVFICVIVAIVCCCIKKQGHAGRVIQPVNTTGVAVVSTGFNTATYGPQPGYGGQQYGNVYGMQQPPAYGMQQPPVYGTNAFSQPPPAYNYSDPAYPPTSSTAATPSQPPASNQPPPPGFKVPQ